MEIVRIIADPKPTLYAIQYDNEPYNELYQFFEQLNDKDALYTFFKEHIADLNQYGIRRQTIKEAVEKTINDAFELEEQLYELAEAGHQDTGEQLQTLFKPLSNAEYRLYPLQKSKSKPHRKSWVRLYAVRIAQHLYVITGGTIKLTKYMNDRKHTRQELSKMERAVDFLKDEGLIDKQDFERLESEL